METRIHKKSEREKTRVLRRVIVACAIYCTLVGAASLLASSLSLEYSSEGLANTVSIINLLVTPFALVMVVFGIAWLGKGWVNKMALLLLTIPAAIYFFFGVSGPFFPDPWRTDRILWQDEANAAHRLEIQKAASWFGPATRVVETRKFWPGVIQVKKVDTGHLRLSHSSRQ